MLVLSRTVQEWVVDCFILHCRDTQKDFLMCKVKRDYKAAVWKKLQCEGLQLDTQENF